MDEWIQLRVPRSWYGAAYVTADVIVQDHLPDPDSAGDVITSPCSVSLWMRLVGYGLLLVVGFILLRRL